VRFLVVFWHTLPLALSFLRDRRRWLVAGGPAGRSDAFHARRAQRLLRTITRLGPSFVKIGQVFAGRADLLPEPYAGTLNVLTDQVPPVPTAAIVSVIEADLGRPLTELFEEFDPDPIASGSLGQVHRARVRGRPVAVKVLRPGVRDLVTRDLAAARAIIGPLVRWAPNPHTRALDAVLAEFSVRIWEELDFRREAENLSAVRANFGANPRIRIPAALPELVTERVLVLEFADGIRIDGLDPRRRYGGLTVDRVVERLIELYLRMMFVHGFFHADPHPGNLLVAPDGALVLLDFGVVIRVPAERRRQLIDTAFASIRNDVEGVVNGFYALGVVEPGAERARIERLANLLLDLAAKRTTTAERMELLTAEVMNELYDWPIRLPSDLVYFARTASLIEGIGIRYDPRFNPVMAAGPVLYRMRGELLPSIGTPRADLVDWPSAIGYLLGRAARGLTDAGDRLARFLADRWRET
jgi:predicted unusual protein kinase regulating ubiquinone biosynthesis (AarF/ABC1/UbiB family)